MDTKHKEPQPPAAQVPKDKPAGKPEEFGGRGGLEPTRYNDWEIGGKCVDF